MQISVLIVDDDQNSIDILKGYLRSFPFIKILDEVNSGEDAITFLRKTDVDLLLLDIEMTGISGLELAKHIQPIYPNVAIIFITGHADFALEGYESGPVDFLTKPLDVLRLEIALNKVKKLKKPTKDKKKEQKIGMKVANGIQIIDVNNILYVEKKGRTIFIVCKNDESYRSTDTMKNLEMIFIPFEFYRSHQSFLVPVNQIKGIYPDVYSRSYSIQLIDSDVVLPLSRNRYPELKELLEQKGIHIY